MQPEDLNDSSKHRFTNPLEVPDPAGAEREPSRRLWEALNSPEARRHYGAIARITGKEWREAGFGIYDRDGNYKVSSLAQSQDDPDRRALLRASETMRMHESLDLTDIILDDDMDHWRRDVVMMLHSHPVGHDGVRATDWLRPSLPDLEVWENGMATNPGLIEAIGVVDGTQLRLLMFRQDPNRTVVPYYQQLDGTESAARVVRVLKESRLNVAMVSYDLKAREFADGSQAALEELFAE